MTSLHSHRFSCAKTVLLVALAGFLGSAVPLAALEVRQTIWGFDGRVVPGVFNPFSALLDNPSDRSFEGDIVFTQGRGLGSQIGAPFTQPVYLAPHASRWVQFHVFPAIHGVEWSLTWGRGGQERKEFDSPATGPPARVFLRDPDDPFAGSTGLQSFPDALFPTTAAGAMALEAVVLDYTPRWEAVRREAFLQWVRAGGIVHVLPTKSGNFPEFSDVLTPLNTAGQRVQIGAGFVLRHPSNRRDFNAQYLADRGFPTKELKRSQSPVVYDLEHTLAEQLAALTRPNIRWWLINLLTLTYVGIVGPVHYWLARRFDYRLSLGIFVGSVALFSWLFAVVGRRGYDESQTVHSLTLARAIEPGRHHTMQWISAFATRGDLYTLTHAAPANLYSAVGGSERINGRILNGREGHFLADIPLYSSRPFVHSAIMAGDDTSVSVVRWEGTPTDLTELVLKTTAAFPANVVDIHVRHGTGIYPVAHKDGHLELNGRKNLVSEHLKKDEIQTLTYVQRRRDQTSDQVLRKLQPLLFARALGGSEVFSTYFETDALPANQLQLFIYAPSPPSFHMHGKGFVKENGYVLYVQDVFRP